MAWLFLSGFRTRAGLKYSDVSRVREARDHLPGAVKTPFQLLIPDLMRVAAVMFLLLALARPQSGTREREVMTEGYDIMLALDVSDSMQGEDFKPANRLEVAKATINRFVKARPSDRIGLVVFAADSFTQAPLTLDHSMILQAVHRVGFDIVDGSRTAIGMGLASCVNRLRPSLAKSRIIILLTDGVNNTGEIDPLTAARLAQAYGIRVYTIGVGSKGKVPYPVQHPVLGKQYQFIDSDLDETTLSEIASLTGAKYFRATDARALEEIYAEINKLEKNRIRTKEYAHFDEIYHLFLLAGLSLLFGSLALSRGIWMTIP
jgi:Ca-activated chloride channel family protein